MDKMTMNMDFLAEVAEIIWVDGCGFAIGWG
jgi:hypothetical protein